MMTLGALGAMTPPVGIAMHVVSGLIDCKVAHYAREPSPLVRAILALATGLSVLPRLVFEAETRRRLPGFFPYGAI